MSKYQYQYHAVCIWCINFISTWRWAPIHDALLINSMFSFLIIYVLVQWCIYPQSCHTPFGEIQTTVWRVTHYIATPVVLHLKIRPGLACMRFNDEEDFVQHYDQMFHTMTAVCGASSWYIYLYGWVLAAGILVGRWNSTRFLLCTRIHFLLLILRSLRGKTS